MAFQRRWLLVLFALILSSGPLSAASTKEQRAYAVAVAAFQDEMWSRAETEFDQFRNKYPDSTNVAAAVLYQAEARYKSRQFTNAITLLSTNSGKAGPLAGEYRYWIGEAQFQNNDFANAAETFASLPQKFPESPLRLRAVVEATSAYMQLTNWPQMSALLEDTNGIFQHTAQMDSGNELVSRGRLLLAQGKFAQNDFDAAAKILALLNPQTLPPQLDWQRAYLLCQVKLAAGDLNGALAATTNLMQIARLENDGGLRAESVRLHAEELENLNRTDEAIAAYRENLTNAPAMQKREAIFKIAELEIVQGQLTNAGETLTNFLAQFPEAISADIALLTAGELHLKNYAASRPAEAETNQLQQAQASFDQFIGSFTNSELLGKAYLNRGWCEWFAEDMTNSLADFETAAQRLPPSEDRAMARFKTGDALFAQKDFTNALENYRAVLDDFTNFPAVTGMLGDRALYQSLRANLQLTNYDGASNAMARILEQYPASDLAPNSALLYGEGLAAAGQPAAAREQFQHFETQFPDASLRPEVEFAIARTYELEQNWPDAIAGYQSWLEHFPTNNLRPQAVYALAWGNSQAGNETNAFGLFTNFVAQFPTNDLAPQAQWWVADHFFGTGTNYVDAERNYEMLYQNTNWQDSLLIYPARIMAGHAAAGRQDYNGAIRDYFSKLEVDTNCPMDLRVQAAFAHGDALMLMDSTDTNKPLANFGLAITNEFSQIVLLNPTNENAALARVEIGKCWLQLANYDAATNAYAQVLSTNVPANISLRSQAQIGWGIALEKKAALATGTNQAALFRLALDNYLDVFDTRFGENDPFWVKQAGLQAAPLVGLLDDTKVEIKFYKALEQLLPQLADTIEKKIAALPPEKN
jgi:TolA-binding protein